MNWLSKRIPTLVGIGGVLGLALLLAVWIKNNQQVVVEGERPESVRVINLADNRFSVAWTTSSETKGYLEYGVVGERIKSKVYDERDVSGNPGKYRTHLVTIEGLQPDTEYGFYLRAGEAEVKFDEGGKPYRVRTGQVIGGKPTAKSVYGTIKYANGERARGALVYLTMPGAEAAAGLTNENGEYTISLATMRDKTGKEFVKYEPTETVLTIVSEDGKIEGQGIVTVAAAQPVPVITLGKHEDFRQENQVPTVAEITPEKPTVFNVEPISISEVANQAVMILNPAREGEEVATTQPEFRGMGPAGANLTITVESSMPYQGEVAVAADGTWEWSPPAELAAGEHTVTIAYVDEQGILQKITRMFSVSQALAAKGDPAFEATPSGGLYASPTASPSARVSNPATGSGVPVSGVVELTWLTGVMGVVMMVLGVFAMAL